MTRSGVEILSDASVGDEARVEAVAMLRELGVGPIMATRLDEQLRALAGPNRAISLAIPHRRSVATRASWRCGARAVAHDRSLGCDPHDAKPTRQERAKARSW